MNVHSRHTPLTPRRWSRTIVCYALLTLLVALCAPWFGPVPLHPPTLLRALFSGESTVATSILWDQRVPRVLLGICVGASLGIAGALFQAILRNPLATPYTLGVASASALAAATTLAFPALFHMFGPFSPVHVAALIGSAIATLLILLIARYAQGRDRTFIILAGVAINMFCAAALLLVRFLSAPHRLVAIDRWTMGGLVTLGYTHVLTVALFCLIGSLIALSQAHALNHITYGEDVAAARGVPTKRVFYLSIIAGIILTAGAVAVAGPIGFVGLVVPHAVRLISGPDHRVVLPASALLAAAVLVACDSLARTLVAPTEIPVGIITAFLGTPLFLILLVYTRSQKYSL